MKTIDVVKSITVEFTQEEAQLLEKMLGKGLNDAWWSHPTRDVAANLWKLLTRAEKGKILI